MNFQHILDVLPFSVYWIDSQKKTFKGGNQHFRMSLKISALSEFVGKPIGNFFLSDYLRVVNELLNKSIQNQDEKFSSAYQKLVNDHEEPILIQCKTPKSKKETITIFSEIYPKLCDFNQYLLDKNEKLTVYLNNIIENIPASIYWKDKHSIILGGSKLHTELTGFSDNKEVIGKSDYDFVWKEFAEQVHENDRFVMQNDQMISFEEKGMLADGKMHTFLTQKSPLKSKSGEIIGILGVSIDITELKNTQKKLKKLKLLAEAANQAKTKFLASMSHDMRTPLTGILGLSKMLWQRLKTSEDKNDLHMIYNASNQLLRLLTNILDIASLENANDLELKTDSFSIQDLAESLQKLLLPSIKSKGLTLQLNLDVSFTKNIESDQSKLERILLNLATNAIKFTEKGKITIIIKELTLPQQSNGVYIEFTVNDTGIGISPEKLTSIFDPLFRIEPSFKKNAETSGYGIGLYTVKKFVRLLGGEIHVKSQLDVGTSFFFTLFMRLTSKNKLLKCKNKTENLQSFVFLDNKKLIEAKKIKKAEEELKKNILLIEDDHLTIKFSKELFMQAGYNLTVVSTLQEAIAFAKNHTFDLIVTDLGLPGLSGNEIAVLYRYWERINKKPMVPIISLTAYGKGKFKEECLAAGINEIWLKPLTKEKIRKLDKYFKRKKISDIELDFRLNQLKSIKSGYDQITERANFLDIIHSYPVYDKSIALKNLNGNVDLFNEIIKMFKLSIKDYIQKLEKNYQLKNWEVFENIVHKIKGGACYVGAVRLNYLCKSFLRGYLTDQQALDIFYPFLISTLSETYQAIDSEESG